MSSIWSREWRTIGLSVLGYLIVATVATSCIISSPIEREPDETNYPPFINKDEINPSDNPIRITSERLGPDELITITAGLTDPNREEQLHIAWLTDQEGLESDETVSRLNNQNDSTPFFNFTPAEFELNPCTDIDGDTLVLHLVVSDGEMTLDDIPENIRPRPDHYLDIYTWKLVKVPGVCNS